MNEGNHPGHFSRHDAFLIPSFLHAQITPDSCVFHMEHNGGVEFGRHRIQSPFFHAIWGMTEESDHGL